VLIVSRIMIEDKNRRLLWYWKNRKGLFIDNKKATTIHKLMTLALILLNRMLFLSSQWQEMGRKKNILFDLKFKFHYGSWMANYGVRPLSLIHCCLSLLFSLLSFTIIFILISIVTQPFRVGQIQLRKKILLT
jgi:hypothetical protein